MVLMLASAKIDHFLSVCFTLVLEQLSDTADEFDEPDAPVRRIDHLFRAEDSVRIQDDKTVVPSKSYSLNDFNKQVQSIQ